MSSEKREPCFFYISVWYIRIWAKPCFALSALLCSALLHDIPRTDRPAMPADATGWCSVFWECRMVLNQHFATFLCVTVGEWEMKCENIKMWRRPSLCKNNFRKGKYFYVRSVVVNLWDMHRVSEQKKKNHLYAPGCCVFLNWVLH